MPKNGGLGQFPDLRGGLAKKKGDIALMHTMALSSYSQVQNKIYLHGDLWSFSKYREVSSRYVERQVLTI